jgi:hypothetical protein
VRADPAERVPVRGWTRSISRPSFLGVDELLPSSNYTPFKEQWLRLLVTSRNFPKVIHNNWRKVAPKDWCSLD